MCECELTLEALELLIGNKHMSEEDYVEFLQKEAQKGNENAKEILAELF